MKKFEGVNCVIFDVDFTLVMHRKDEVKILANALGIPFSDELSKQYYAMQKQCYLYFEIQKVTLKKFTQLVNICMPILIKYNVSAKRFIDTWFSIDSCFINEDTLEVLHYLQAKGYKIFILTDCFYEKQIRLLENFDILPYVDEVYACNNVYLKRNPKSASRIIAPGHEAEYVMVGDSLKDDIAFANNSGIRSIWYNPLIQKNKTKFKPTAEISSLLEICGILK